MVIQLYSTPFSPWYYIYLAVSERDHSPFSTKSCGFWQTRALTEVGSLPRREFRCLASVSSLQHYAVEGVGTQQLSESKTSCIPKWNSHVQNHIKFTFGKKIKPNQAFIKSYKREISRYPQACRPYFNNWRPGGKWKLDKMQSELAEAGRAMLI